MPQPTLVDLHMHSTISDGTLRPVELVQAVHQAGIHTFSLTDHDATDGLKAAGKEAERLGIRLINGVELSAIFPGGTLHILGYHIDEENPKLQEKLLACQNAREKRNHHIIQKLIDYGVETSYQELKDLAPDNKSLGRPHIAQLLIQKGIARDINHAFEEFLSHGQRAFVSKEIFTAEEAIQIIHDAGGIAIVAHPMTLRLPIERITAYLTELKGYGLDGIEAYNSAHPPDRSRRYARLAQEMGLLVTAGSDFHGDNKKGVVLGCIKNKEQITEDLISPEALYPSKIR